MLYIEEKQRVLLLFYDPNYYARNGDVHDDVRGGAVCGQRIQAFTWARVTQNALA
jgi:hypothetical protein